jgi:nitrogen fixation/metabolism regulation signal transduction histidine kinase
MCVYDFSHGYFKKNEFFFKEIKRAFLDLNTAKELQQQYLRKILELIDVGILVYEIDRHTIFLSNDAFRKMTRMPAVKSINWLKTRNDAFYNDLLNLQTGDNKTLSLNINHQIINVLANATSFQTKDGNFKLIAFQDVNATLEEVEAMAWKRLLSVMTHEIMNSITPVLSLADTLKNRMDSLKNDKKTLQESDIEDIVTGIETIKHRSDGLLQFAETYRNLNRPITLNIAPTNMKHLFENIHRLMNPSLKQQGIEFRILAKGHYPILNIDPILLEQVLINLIVNASDAVRHRKNSRILLSCELSLDGKVSLSVSDNGAGIAPDMIDKIFIPFFSTKKKGSGIGLSLSRQIVQQHNGSLILQTQQGEGSVFTIVL